MNKTTSIIIGVVLVAASFYGGITYEKSVVAKATAARTAQFAGRAGGAGGFGGRGGGMTMGSILSNDGQSLTVQLTGGGSEIVFLTSSTTIMKSSIVAPTSLTTGQNVSVAGSKNSDGSVTATLIQVRPTPTAPTQ